MSIYGGIIALALVAYGVISTLGDVIFILFNHRSLMDPVSAIFGGCIAAIVGVAIFFRSSSAT